MKRALFNGIRFSKPSDVCWGRAGLIGKFMEIVTHHTPLPTTYSTVTVLSLLLKIVDYINHPSICPVTPA
jgi:hypothetical protein